MEEIKLEKISKLINIQLQYPYNFTENNEEYIMVTYSTNELIPSSEFAKKFGTYLSQIKDNTVDKLAILKNNKVEAIIISKDEYESMKEALKEVEAKKILQSIQSGLDDVKNGKTHPIGKLWDEL